jgi:hypothetical protein
MQQLSFLISQTHSPEACGRLVAGFFDAAIAAAAACVLFAANSETTPACLLLAA